MLGEGREFLVSMVKRRMIEQQQSAPTMPRPEAAASA